MNIEIRKSFVKDSQKLSNQQRTRLFDLIENIGSCQSVFEIPHCKKMQGHKNVYRIKFGQYRIGFFLERNTIEFVRVLLRKDIYRYFP